MRRTWMTVVVLVSIGCGSVPPEPRAPAPVPQGRVASRAPGHDDPIASLFPVVYSPSETLPDAMRQRIRAALKDQSRATITLHHIIDIPRPDGRREVFALYEYNLYEDCLLRFPYPDTCTMHLMDQLNPALRDYQAIPPRTHQIESFAPSDFVALGAVRAVFAPPSPGTPVDAERALSIAATLFTMRAHITGYNRVLVADVDGDHALELYLDLTSEMDASVGASLRNMPTPRSPRESRWRRDLYILSGTDLTRTELEVGLETRSGTGEFVPRALVELRDVDGDGHLDVVRGEPDGCTGMSSQDTGRPCDGAQAQRRIAHMYAPGTDTYKPGVSLDTVQAAPVASSDPDPDPAATATSKPTRTDAPAPTPATGAETAP